MKEKNMKNNREEKALYLKIVHSSVRKKDMFTKNPIYVEGVKENRWVEIVPTRKMYRILGMVMRRAGGRLSILDVREENDGSWSAGGLLLEFDEKNGPGTNLNRKSVDVRKLEEIEWMYEEWHKGEFSLADVEGK